MYLDSPSLQEQVKIQIHYGTFHFIIGNLSMNKLDRKELKGAAKSKRFAGSIKEYPDRDIGRINTTYQKRHNEKRKSKFGIN